VTVLSSYITATGALIVKLNR